LSIDVDIACVAAAPTPSPTEGVTTCTPTWSTHDGQNSIHGDRRPGISTVEACRAACLALPRCEGLDWDPTAAIHCWLHRQLNGPYHYPGVTQHRLLDRCQSTTGTLLPWLRRRAELIKLNLPPPSEVSEYGSEVL